MAVPPNNYPFYTEGEKYEPIMQADGGQLSGGQRCSEPCSGQGWWSPCWNHQQLHLVAGLLRESWHQLGNLCCHAEWKPMYHPTLEQAEIDRRKAYEAGVPHGFVAPGDKYRDLPTINLTVVSDLVRLAWLTCHTGQPVAL